MKSCNLQDMLLETTIEPECKGNIYKCRITYYLDTKGTYTEKITMTPLKRQSCPGCEQCGPILDQLPDFVSNDTSPLIELPEHNALYRLAIVNESRDWESGIIDSWDMQFSKLVS